MVELLISSDVAKYCEFKTISRVLTWSRDTDQLERVPCSRADVFSSKQVSMIEKRMMMKFLQFAAAAGGGATDSAQLDDGGEPQATTATTTTTFHDFLLKDRKLTPNVCHYIQHSIAMVNDHATTQEVG